MEPAAKPGPWAQASHPALGCGSHWSCRPTGSLDRACPWAVVRRSRALGPKEIAIAMTRLAGLLGDVRAATAFRYDAHDSAGNRMDTAKVIPSPAGGYLAVYHDHEICHLATSTDLMTWTHRAVIDEPATQPTIAATGDGGLLTAVEFNDGHGGALPPRPL